MTNARRIRRAAASVAVGVSLVGAATVLAATGPGLDPAGGQATTTVPGQPTMTMTGTMTPGGSVTVEAEGFLPGSTVTITMDGSSVPVASGVATALGKATIRLTIPADMAAGVHTMVLAGTSLGGQVAQLTTSMTIGAVGGAAVTPAAPTGMEPAFTG